MHVTIEKNENNTREDEKRSVKMSFINGVTNSVGTNLKKTISLVGVLLSTLIMIFGSFLKFKNEDMADLFRMVLSKDVRSIVDDKALSMLDYYRACVDMGLSEDAMVYAGYMLVILVLGIAAVFFLLQQSRHTKKLMIGVTVFSVIHIVLAIGSIAQQNEQNRYDLFTLGLSPILAIVFAVTALVFWIAFYNDLQSLGQGNVQLSAAQEMRRIAGEVAQGTTQLVGQASQGATQLVGQAKESSTCPHCGKLNLPTAKFCNSCGQANVRTAAPTQRPAQRPTQQSTQRPMQQSTQQSTTFCGGCGQPVLANAKFCKACGQPTAK